MIGGRRRTTALVAALVAAAAPGAARAEDAVYELRVADAAAEVGAAIAISLTIVPAGGRTVSHDGPLRVDLTADDGVALTRRRYARRDAADPAADAPRFDLKLKALAAGDHPLAIDARFWLCGARVCRPVRAHRAIVVHVAPRAQGTAGAPTSP
jgi:hypothetical protein